MAAALVIELGAARRAVEQLAKLGRLDLRRNALRMVVSESREGRDGYRVASTIQMERLRRVPVPGGAA